MKNKFTTALILTITFILAGVAIFTAIRLYQLRNSSITPTNPESKPAAAGNACGGIAGIACPAGEQCVYAGGAGRAPFPDAAGTCQIVQVNKSAAACSLSFTIGATSTATATATSTASGSPTGTPTYCGASCGTSNSNCQSSSICYQGTCRNPSCVTESDCTCQGATTTPGPTQPSLPNSGTGWPTILGAGLGILVVFGSLLLAL